MLKASNLTAQAFLSPHNTERKMATSLLVAVAKEIVTNLISLAGKEMNLAWGFMGELKRLSRRLKTVQALLHDAESRQAVKMEMLEDWLQKVKAVACEADDVLDEFAFEVLRRKFEVQNRMRNKVRNFFSLSNPLAFRIQMAHKFNDINSKLDDIYKEANDIGLRMGEIINVSVQLEGIRQTYLSKNIEESRWTHPYCDDSEVVGRDDDVSIILDRLLCYDEEEVLPIISVVGMAGLGKTTLAKLVYNNEKVVSNFDENMWVCVSDDFNVQRLLNEMVQSLTKTTCEMSNIEGTVRKLRENLEGKRYLLVLDDVWNEVPEKWGNMRNSLLGIGGSRSSKIIVTTRSEVVASTMRTSFIHHLVGLSDDDSWNIFEQRAFAKGGPKESQNLVVVGRRLVRRCGGVPLAIKALGGLMHSKKNEHDWLLIEGSEIWSLSEKVNGTDILPSLRLSFDHLQSPSLRQCFAYCSLFPKDFCIERNNLIQLWMAQGFLQATKESNMLMEDVGNNYFEILLWNSLLQDVTIDEYEEIESCKMHDLVHDFALHITNNYCLTSMADEVGDVSNVQHLSLVASKEVPQISKGGSKKLRTLFSTGNLLGDLLIDSTCLRVLKLVKSHIVDLPISISKMMHLRYLDISNTPIKVLPNFISKLYNLQTLRILYCRCLEELPRDFRKLINLRHFYMDDEEKHRNLMPMGLGQLTCLQTLPFFVVGQDKGREIEELGCLSNLRGAVKIYGLEHVKSNEDAQKENLSSNPSIRELKFHWNNGREDYTNINEDEDVLEGLKPHNNLKGLVIENFGGGKLASWMMVTDHTLLLYNLVKLKLYDCKRLEQIPALGHLPSLKVLTIKGMPKVKCIGIEFYGHDTIDGGNGETAVFPALRVLRLEDMPNLVEWCEAAGTVFPCLEELSMEHCAQLIMAPSHFQSVKHLTIRNIKGVVIRKMSSKLTSLISLNLENVSGSEINFALEEMFKSNTSLLKEVRIYSCDGLTHVPNTLRDSVCLETLRIRSCPNLITISDINSLTPLRELSIYNCEKLIGLPEGIGNLASLEHLEMYNCPNLRGIIMPSLIHNLTSLGDLIVGQSGCSL